MHYIPIIYPAINPIPISYLEIDCDPKAERIQVFNRKNGELLAHKTILNQKFTKFLDSSYSLEPSIICVMLDDNAEFNAAILDNVKPMLVDLVSFNPNNPQPYEPIP